VKTFPSNPLICNGQRSKNDPNPRSRGPSSRIGLASNTRSRVSRAARIMRRGTSSRRTTSGSAISRCRRSWPTRCTTSACRFRSRPSILPTFAAGIMPPQRRRRSDSGSCSPSRSPGAGRLRWENRLPTRPQASRLFRTRIVRIADRLFGGAVRRARGMASWRGFGGADRSSADGNPHSLLTGRTACGCSRVSLTSSVSWRIIRHSPSRSVYCTSSRPISTSRT
jgi:hypothetical protein